jgi:hypothetical protein
MDLGYGLGVKHERRFFGGVGGVICFGPKDFMTESCYAGLGCV